MKKLIILLLFCNYSFSQVSKDSIKPQEVDINLITLSEINFNHLVLDSTSTVDQTIRLEFSQGVERELVKHYTCGNVDIYLYKDGWEVQFLEDEFVEPKR